MNKAPTVVFGCEAGTPRALQEAALLAESLRRFGGAFAGCPFWVLAPDPAAAGPALVRRLHAADAGLLPYPRDQAAAAFPFTGRLLAAAHAETLAAGRGLQLVWMDSGSLIMREPGALALPPGKVLACRPVDHANIGSPWGAPPDAFWRLVFDRCAVPEERVYAVDTAVDGLSIRAYFNAGLLAFHPEAGILRRWLRSFDTVCRDPVFEPLYAERPARRTFVHQAVLAGVVLAELSPGQIFALPSTVNYPLHMHGEAISEYRAASPAVLVTCRYEDLLAAARWQEDIFLPAPVIDWLAGRLAD